MRSPKLLHTLSALAATALIALAGCGGDEEASSPLDEALGYLPADAGFAFIVSTDLGDYAEARKLIDKFPFGGQIQGSLEQSLEGEGINFKEDLEPILGNEVVVGIDENAEFVGDGDPPIIMAGQAEDGGKLRDLIRKDAEESGEREGYDIYTGGADDFMAIKDDVFVFSEDEETLNRALERRGGDDRLTEDDLDEAFTDLPDDAPVRVYADIAALLEASPSPDAEEALKIKWVEHLETLGMAANANESEVTIDYSLRTDSEGLSDDDLPMAPGGEAPQVLERDSGSSEVVLGVRDPSQLFDFGVAAARAIDPAGYAQFETGKQGVGKRLGINVDEDVVAQLTGDVSAVVRLDGSFGVRAALEDAKAFEGTLDKIMKGLPEFSDDVTVAGAGSGFYRVAADGEDYTIGVAEGALIVASDARLAEDVAARDLVEAEGQEGAFVSVADAERIANELIGQFAGGLEGIGGSLFTGPLGDLTSSAEASTDGITGSLKLEIE